MKRILPLFLVLCLLLSGCSLFDGSYTSITPHREHRQSPQEDSITAASYSELTAALEQLIAEGAESAAILVPDYPEQTLDSAMRTAEKQMKQSYCVGAYALEEMTYELGTSAGVPAVAVEFTYSRSLTDIRRIQHVQDMEAALSAVAEALRQCDASVVLLVEAYRSRDLTQFVQDYALENPNVVMETPQVSENIYGSGAERVLELTFTYQNSRDSLRQMQTQVATVFRSAGLYVSGDGAPQQKYAQLYAFLMERYDYTLETSLTPAYSLLRHGVGDSRAFATVYAAMCRSAGLPCLVVTGTYSGVPRTWNMIQDGENYYHLDLLRCSELGGFFSFEDAQMTGYVWDYSAYPVSIRPKEPPTEPTTEPETVPATEAAENSEGI